MDKILTQLEEDCRISAKQLAIMNDKTEEEVDEAIKDYEKQGVILGYSAIIDWDKTDKQFDQERARLMQIKLASMEQQHDGE